MPRSKPLRRCSHGRRELAESFGSDPERYDRTRPRYTPTTCFETFPFPRPTDTQRDAIAQAARDLDRLRTGWLNPPGLSDTDLARRTLTNLYKVRLACARRLGHRAIDPGPAADKRPHGQYGISEGPGPPSSSPGVPSGASHSVVVRLPADRSAAAAHDSVSFILQSPIATGSISVLQVTGSGLRSAEYIGNCVIVVVAVVPGTLGKQAKAGSFERAWASPIAAIRGPSCGLSTGTGGS